MIQRKEVSLRGAALPMRGRRSNPVGYKKVSLRGEALPMRGRRSNPVGYDGIASVASHYTALLPRNDTRKKRIASVATHAQSHGLYPAQRDRNDTFNVHIHLLTGFALAMTSRVFPLAKTFKQ